MTGATKPGSRNVHFLQESRAPQGTGPPDVEDVRVTKLEPNGLEASSRNAVSRAKESGPLDAWRAVSRTRPVLERAELLQKQKDKAEVWRLTGRPRGDCVIAKRCRLVEADREELVYSSVLPRIGMATGQYLGRVDAGDGRTAWLFVKELVGVPYDAEEPLHRDLAAAWLSALHAAAREAPAVADLPDVGPPRYRPMLEDLVRTLAQASLNEELGRSDLEAIEQAASCCHEVSELWPRIERAVRRLPQTLVHGSFSRRNMVVIPTSGQPVLGVFDWGAAGCGVPARDLVKLVDPKVAGSVAIYWRKFPDVAPSDQDLLVAVGRLIRAVEHMSWVAPGCHHPCLSEPMRRLAAHGAQLVAARDVLLGLV